MHSTLRSQSHPSLHQTPVLWKSLATLLVILSWLTSLTAADRTESTVILDPGHGGRDGGACHGGVAEKDVNLHLALAVEHYLHRYGINTALTRTADDDLTLKARARYASHFQAPLFVSIHYNAAPRKSAHGIETFYATNSSRTLAAMVQHTLVQSTRANDRGVRHAGFHVIKKNVAPVSILIEGGFLTNARERRQIAHAGYRDLQARAIAAGIAQYLGRTSHHVMPPTPSLGRLASLPMPPPHSAWGATPPPAASAAHFHRQPSAPVTRPPKRRSLLSKIDPRRLLPQRVSFRR